MFFNKQSVEDLEDEKRELQSKLDSAEYEVKELKEKVSRFKRDQELVRRQHDDDLQDLKYEHKRSNRKREEEITDLEAENARLNDQIEVLQEEAESTAEVTRREIQVEAREAAVEAAEATTETFSKKLNEERDNSKKCGEQRYQAGYADGLADGLRKAHEITAEDRKANQQVALIAAASHSDGATREIAKAISKEVHKALPSGQNNGSQANRKK